MILNFWYVGEMENGTMKGF